MVYSKLVLGVKWAFLCFLLILSGCEKEGIVNTEYIEYFAQDVCVDGPFATATDKLETDRGVILLPDNYSSSGVSVPLVIYCHSGGGSVYKGRSEAQDQTIVKYLLFKGYAVVSAAGMPETYSSRLDIDHGRTVGSHIAHRAYKSAYEYAIHKYNIKKDGCFIFGNSNGGLSMMNLHNLTDIPILAMAGISPLLSLCENAWNISSASLRPQGFSSFQNRANIIRLFGMKDVDSLEDLENAKYEQDKVREYDPYVYCLTKEKFAMRAPLLIFNPKNDFVVRREYAEHLAFLLNNRSLNQIEISPVEEFGGHTAPAKPLYVGEFVYKGEVLKINQTIELIYQFFEQHR